MIQFHWMTSVGGEASSRKKPLHDDFKPETVKRYSLELCKYFMLKFPDSIYLPNTLRPTPQIETQSNEIVPVDEFSVHSLSVVEYAIEEQDLDLLTLLFELTAGDFLQAVDSLGRSYLHRAAAQGKLLLVQWLVEIGRVNPWSLCNGDRTALEYVNPVQHEETAVYLTKEMTKVAPEFRVKTRRGGKRMLIREWMADSGSGETIASRFIGGRDSFLPSPVHRAALQLGSDDVDQMIDSAFSSAANTPRGNLNPVLRVKSPMANGGVREEYDLISRPEGSPKNKRGGGNTTHIHVYPPLNGNANGLQSMSSPHSRSLPALKAGTPKSPSKFNSNGGGGFTSPKTPKKQQSSEEEYDELESYAAGMQNGASSSSTALNSANRRKLHGYHWEFLERPTSSRLMVHAVAPSFMKSPSSSPTHARQSQQQQQQQQQQLLNAAQANAANAESFVNSANSVEHTLYSLQATTSNLQQLLSDLHVQSPTNNRTQRRR